MPYNNLWWGGLLSGRVPAFHAEGPGFNPRSVQRKKEKAGSRGITPPTCPLSRVGRYKAGSGWCM